MQDKTHVVTTPNRKPQTSLDVLRVELAGDYQKQVLNYYGGSKTEAMRFMTASIEYVRKVPKLLECDRTSLILALVQSAQFRFLPSGVSGEAYVIPYGKEAKFQIGYQGIVTLLYRAGIESITANIVYANDDFEYQEGLDARLVHKPTKFGKPKGDAVGVYTVIQAKGIKTFKVMSKDDVMAIKNMSKAKATPDSPWNSDKDPEKWMWKKTCLIQHGKLYSKSAELQRAIEKDFEGEGLNKPQLDAGGPAVAPALHTITSSDEPTAEQKERIIEAERKESQGS